MLTKCKAMFETSFYQFGFKKNHSTNLCSFVVNEVIDHFVRKDSPVYTCLLDCSKAFDRLDYAKMFDVLTQQSVCPYMIQFLLYAYTHQSACVKWRGTTGNFFPVTNGVKQGGVISPILFTMYMDVLLKRLVSRGAGCWLTGRYCGSFAYADDVILLAPSRQSLICMLHTCAEFAREFNVNFNASKTKMILFSIGDVSPVPFMNNVLEIVPHEKHLGFPIGANSNTLLVESMCQEIMSKTNMLHCTFSRLPVDALYQLFRTYCTPLYGCHLLDFTSRDCERLFVTWRKAIRFLFKLPPTTHCALLPLICHDIPFDLQLHRRVAKFFSSCINSSNLIVRSCAEAALHSGTSISHSLTLLSRKYRCSKISLVNQCHSPAPIEDDCVTASIIHDILNMQRQRVNHPFALTSTELKIALHICTE